MVPVRIAIGRWYVVGNHEPIKTNFFKSFYYFIRVDVPVTDETLVKTGDIPLNVPEMYVDNFLLTAKVSNCLDDTIVSTHFRPATHTKIKAVIGTVEAFHSAIKGFKAAEDSGNST